MGRDEETIRLTIPADPQYVDVAVAAIEALADRAGVDGDELIAIRGAVHRVLAERLAERNDDNSSGEVVLRYAVGDGYLGVKVVDPVTAS